MLTLVISLVKDKKWDISAKDNYRPIDIACIVSKVLELVILFKYGNFVDTADNQFGYKEASSVEMCIFNFKGIINYYKSMLSNIYVCVL